MKITKRQNNPISFHELTVGMIVVGSGRTNLVLSIVENQIYWLNQKGKICFWRLGPKGVFDGSKELLIIENE